MKLIQLALLSALKSLLGKISWESDERNVYRKKWQQFKNEKNG